MSETSIFREAEAAGRAAWPTGLRFDGDKDEPELYTVRLQARNNGWPVLSRGRIVVFAELSLAKKALEIDDDPSLRGSVLPPLNVDETDIYDVADCLTTVDDGEVDTSHELLDYLNLLYDLVGATKLNYPRRYRKVLYDLADHLTFEHEFASYLNRSRVGRVTIRNAILWSLGAVLAQSTFIAG